MRKTEQFATVVLAFICLLLTACSGGGGCVSCVAANPTPTATPTASPTPTPTSAIVWKQALPPAQGANLLSLVVSGSTILAAGVQVQPSGSGTNAYAASFTDNGTSVSTAMPTSLSDPSDIPDMTLIDPSTAFAVGSTTATPAAFTLNPANGAFLSIKPFACAAGTTLAPTLASATGATAVAQDGTTMFVALRESADVPAIIKTDAAGNVDCSQTAIRVFDANANAGVNTIHVSGQNLYVAGNFNGLVQGFIVRLDKSSGVRNWEAIIGGRLVSGVVVDDPNNALYVGETFIGTQDKWFVEKFPTNALAPALWRVTPIAPSQAQTADMIVALLANPAGGVIAVGQTTPLGATDPNNVQTSIAVVEPVNGATVGTPVKVNVFPGDQEHVGSAALGPNGTVYVGGTKSTPNVGNAGAWMAKLSL